MQLFSSRVLRNCGLSLIFTCFFVASFIWYFCSNQTCSLSRFNKPHWRRLKANRQLISNWTSQKAKLHDATSEENKLYVVKSDFNIKGSDVIVFLHIQNTGGSVFARHMVEDLALERPCRCKKNRRVCRCYRPDDYGSTWFFSRYTTGWKCGVHPDWSQLSGCVDRVLDEDEGKPVKRRLPEITSSSDSKVRNGSHSVEKVKANNSTPTKTPQKKDIKKNTRDEESENYEMTPVRSSYTSYDISEIKSDDSDDETKSDQTERKPIPEWASGMRLRNALIQQQYYSINTDELFGNVFETPNLCRIMGEQRKKYLKKRTSSAIWNSPSAFK